ncbi:MAG: ABC transporter ATP-binding protein [Rhodospirillaceae bacterium]|nr:ABC transporter ATP-binding protein [Rhodospirillaceae bacterium]
MSPSDAGATDAALLAVRDLSAGYGRIPILHGVSLTLAAGEIVGVLGHNGMGKTTLLRALRGELKATAGTIRFAGRDVTRASAAARARLGLGYVPQGRGIFPSLTVEENLRMGEIARDGESLVPRMLEEFPILRELRGRRGGALSGGEQQILALARCLVGRPRLVLLDEPSEGIQPSIVDEIVAHLRAFRESWGLAVLLVEQDLDIVGALAGRVLVMQKGRIVAEVAPDALADRAVVEELLGI